MRGQLCPFALACSLSTAAQPSIQQETGNKHCSDGHPVLELDAQNGESFDQKMRNALLHSEGDISPPAKNILFLYVDPPAELTMLRRRSLASRYPQDTRNRRAAPEKYKSKMISKI
jgi:hypothetical protein